MTNDHPHSIPVEINGKERVFKLGPKALRIARERHGIRVRLSELSDPDLDALVRFAWMACLPDSPTYTLEQFEQDMDEDGGMFDIIAKAGEALSKLAEGNKGKKKPTGKKETPTTEA